MIPRSDYPAGRRGYLRWRRALHVLHAREVAAILTAEGYDESTIRRVQDLVQKKHLGRDAEVQILEDALCLVFLETQLHDLGAQLDDEKLLGVLRKTLRKMSPDAIQRDGELPLDAAGRALLQRAIAG